MAHLSGWLAGEDLDVRELRTTDVERFLSARRGAGHTHYLSANAMRPMLAFLRDQGVLLTPAPAVALPPLEVALDRYREYLVHERGLGHATARNYVDAVRPFLRRRLSPDGNALDWDSLDAADVTAFVVARTPSQSRCAAKMTVTALRSLLGFLYVDGLIARRLTGAVPSVAGWRLAGLPKALTPAEIQALFASCDRRTRMGRRDFAVLTTLVRSDCLPVSSPRFGSTTSIGGPAPSSFGGKAAKSSRCRGRRMSVRRWSPICAMAGRRPRPIGPCSSE